ncbi:PAS domain S-box-containing protein [Halovenus aranensis]|jgi:PAS domain S-box-containing protein|uniref:histidine kinase n=1 Tax=Halovenus aranensis TaxID=890420 RepID=A0A1G8RTU3_9EURY|nr:PAS domain-containing sensor histidine kinase [Halovenus aranensis]SDJ20359.1 PAS domain S-box-containing protein [Halovenus aranensis]
MVDNEHSDDPGRPSSRHEQLLAALGDPVWTFDTGGQFGYVNPAFEQKTGYSAATAEGKPLTLVMDDDAQRLLSAAGDLEKSETPQRSVEATLCARDGETTPVECTLTVTGDQPYGVVVAHDITAHKAREKRLSKFASVVSHDLRNPLDVALGRAEMLPEIADVDEESSQHLEEIYDSLTHMEQLIQDVLTLTRETQETVETEPVEVTAVAREAWGNVATDAATLTVSTDIEVLAHRTRLLRLFENLFRNAIEHGGPTESNGEARNAPSDDETADAVSVQVKVVEDGGPVGFAVIDDGPGIDEADRERLFEGGYSTADKGTGLGLTIVREIADSHGWTVRVGDGDGEGSGARFEVTGVTIARGNDSKA